MVPSESDTPSQAPAPITDPGVVGDRAGFTNLRAPQPVAPTPQPGARWLAFASTVTAGLLGGLIGYGVGDLLGQSSLWAAVGAMIGALVAAIGVGIVANLTLQAMAEWRTINHPEQDEPPVNDQ